MSVNRIDRKAEVLATVAGRPAIWAMPHGKGWVIAGDGDKMAFKELARDVAYNLSKLDPAKRDASEVDTDWDGVYATLLSDNEVILYNSNNEPHHKTVCGTTDDPSSQLTAERAGSSHAIPPALVALVPTFSGRVEQH